MKHLITKDDYGNYVFFDTDRNVVYSTDEITGNLANAFWKTKDKTLIYVTIDGTTIQEFKEREHSLEWRPMSITGVQNPPEHAVNLVTIFKIIENEEN